jgi:hypothetical protein
MIRKLALLTAVAFVVLLQCALAQSAPQPTNKKVAPKTKQAATTPQTQFEPKAIEILKGMSAKLASAKTVSFKSIETFENPSRQGHPLVYVLKSEVTLQRPDKLRVITPGDGPSSEFYYDGKQMMAFSPAENFVAIAAAPSTIDTTLEALYHASGTYFPFTDLIVADPYKDAAPGMTLAYYVGQSHYVDNTTTDIVAFVGDGVFAEMWIGVEDRLPRLVHAIYLNDPAQLRHNLLLSDWKLDETLSADTFTNSKVASARRIAFEHPNAQPPRGAKPPAKPKSTKTK